MRTCSGDKINDDFVVFTSLEPRLHLGCVVIPDW